MGKNLNTTVCECGYKFERRDIKPPLEGVEHGFYGGRVKRKCAAVCPKCGKEYKLYLKPEYNSYTIIDMEEAAKGEGKAEAKAKAPKKAAK